MTSNNLYFFKDEVLEKRIIEIVNENPKPVLIVDYNDDYVWLKRPKETNSNLFHKIFYFITRIKALAPVSYKTKEEALAFEVTKLQRLKGLGVNVPEVLGCRKDYFVLENTGKCLKNYLKESHISDDLLESILEKCVNVLSDIHNASEYHAGSQIKNYTLSEEGIVSAIDFEDSFSEKNNLEDLQFRDFFLFLFSLTKLKRDINYKKLINLYKKNTKKETINQKLKKIAQNMNFLTKIVEIEFIKKKASNDVIYSYNLIKILQQL